MPYSSAHSDFTKALYVAKTCPFLVFGNRCVGGDYCPFPEGEHMMCCFWCPRFHDCPDSTGICGRFVEE